MSETSMPGDARSKAPLDGPASRAFIKSFGRQMNVRDSQPEADLAAGEVFAETQSPEDASDRG